MKPLVLSVAALIPARLRRAPSGESRRRTCRSGLRRCLARKSYSSLDLHTVRLNVGASRSCDVDISGPLCDEIGWTHRIAINPSRPDSYERQCHDSGVSSFLLDLREGEHAAVRDGLMEPRLERFIGVIYRPETERWSHYSAAILPRQFDAWIWLDETSAVTPLPTVQREGAEETYPFGL